MGNQPGAMEDVEGHMSADDAFWSGKRVLLTGHTGFKGSWLALWLQRAGAEVHGLALEPPTTPALFDVASVGTGMVSAIGDIRDYATVRTAFEAAEPEIVLHLAAQPLVRRSYLEPLATYATNVMGTAHVLEAARHVGGVRAIVVVSSDKCYENVGRIEGYGEDAPMGGHDPYSSSKGCTELVAAAYRSSFFAESGTAVATARAGNVIGGGDWAEDRLIPDILRAIEKGEAATIRNPQAVRPWQHVLEPLSGYLELARHLFGANGRDFAEGWNFGPNPGDACPVGWIADHVVTTWGAGASWRVDRGDHPHEANHLALDISKAKTRLGWAPRWSVASALDRTIDWHRAWSAGVDMKALCLEQIREYGQASDPRHIA